MTLSGRKKLLCEEKALDLYTFFWQVFFSKPIFWKIINNFDYIYRPRDHDIPTNSDSENSNSEMVATVSRPKSNVEEERSDNFKHELWQNWIEKMTFLWFLW